MAASIGCGSARRSATRAAMPTGQSAPGEMIPSTRSARASRSIAGLVLGRDDRALVRVAEPGRLPGRGRPRSRRARARRAAREQPELRGPAPRTRRRGRARSGARHQTSFSRYHSTVCSSPARSSSARASPSAVRASSVEPMWRSTWPGRSSTKTTSASAAGRREHRVGDVADGDVDPGRDVDDLAGERHRCRRR